MQTITCVCIVQTSYLDFEEETLTLRDSKSVQLPKTERERFRFCVLEMSGQCISHRVGGVVRLESGGREAVSIIRVGDSRWQSNGETTNSLQHLHYLVPRISESECGNYICFTHF